VEVICASFWRLLQQFAIIIRLKLERLFSDQQKIEAAVFMTLSLSSLKG
jgi:hypothetical protein